MAETSEPLRRAAAIAELVVMEPDGMTVAKIAEKLALPVASAYRTVRRLVDVGFLEGEGRHASYTVGPRLRHIASFVSGGGAFSPIAELVLKSVADRLGVSIYLAGFFEDKVSLLMVKTPAVARSPSVHPGPSFQIHASASGKLLLAYQPKSVIDAIIAKGLVRLTDRTITEPDAFRVQLDEIRSQGFAVSIGESDPSMWGIASPIQSANSHVNYAVGLITFRRAIEDDEAYIREVSPILKEAAQRIQDFTKFS